LPCETKPFQEIPSFSPGLEFLKKVDHLFVKQTVKMCEVLTGGWCLAANEYIVTTSAGQDLLKVDFHFLLRNLIALAIGSCRVQGEASILKSSTTQEKKCCI